MRPMTGNPFLHLLGVEEDAARDGRAELRLEATDEHTNPSGAVHGGVLATLVDAAMGAAIRSLSDEGDTPATSQLTITYLRPGKPGTLRVDAQVRKQGEHLTVCEANVEQDGEALVHAVATFAVLHSG
jgi:uncharacterized protein (TIGR00369 family)